MSDFKEVNLFWWAEQAPSLGNPNSSRILWSIINGHSPSMAHNPTDEAVSDLINKGFREISVTTAFACGLPI